MEYTFNYYNQFAYTGLTLALKQFLKDETKPPVIVCIGSDLVIGDSLGPITGSLLKSKTNRFFIYGNLNTPITAKEIKYLNNFLKETHPNQKIIAIDAAVGNEGDIGLIKVTDSGLHPGTGANKKLGKVGDISVMGIIAEKNLFNYSTLNSTRLNIVWKMSKIISNALVDCI